MNSLLTLDDRHVLAFDRYRNILMLERSNEVTSERERSKIDLAGCIRVGEDVTKAIHGYLNIDHSIKKDENASGALVNAASRSYLQESDMSEPVKVKEETKEGEDQVMITE